MNENEIIVGNLIADARKKKKLTQQELAKLLNVSDKAVSAWETGKNYPDLGVIKNISKYLDIDLINILADKNNKNWKKVLKVFIIIIAILFVVSSFTFGIYFFNNYNKIKVYEVKLDSKEYILDSGIVVVTPNEILFNFGDIKHNLDIEDDINISLYYLADEKKTEIISKFNYNFLYYECVNEYEELNNLIVEISYKEKNQNIKVEIPLLLEEKINNKDFVYKKKKVELTEKEERVKVLLHNVGYKKQSDSIYVRESDDITYTYNVEQNIFSYKFVEDEFEKNCIYDIEKNTIYFYVEYEGYEIEKFTYDNEKVNCLLGKCKDSKDMINLLLEEYKKLK